MVVKFFSNKKGGSSKAINYLLNHREQEGTARVLQGDPQLTRQIINDIKFKQKTTVGCLSFEEKNISEEMKHQLIEDFERMLIPGLDKSRYNILWVEHTDKGRLELNFVIPKIELETQKSLNPYYHKADLPRVEKWQDLQNLKYNYSSPKDPSKERNVEINSHIKKFNKSYEQLNESIQELVQKGQLQNREQMIELLKNSGIEVTRTGKDYISVKMPDSKKARKFKGGIYEQQFTSIREIEKISKTAEQRVREYNNRDTQAEQQRLTRELESYTREKEQKLRAIYPKPSRTNERELYRFKQRDSKDTQEQTRRNEREITRGNQVQDNINSDNNIHTNDNDSIRDSVLHDKQTIQSRDTNNILLLHDRTQGEINDSTRTRVIERTPTRARPEFKAYIKFRKPRSELLAELKKTARALREQSIADSTKLPEEYRAVAPRISSDDYAREESLLKQARENYRAFDSYKRIAERVAEAVGKVSIKFEQFGDKILQFFDRARGKQSDNAKAITRINEKIEREKHQSQSHHHLRFR